MTLLLIQILGWGAFLLILFSVVYYIYRLITGGRGIKSLDEYLKAAQVLALTLGFIHGYFMAHDGGGIAGYFTWLILAVLMASELFFRPQKPGAKWKGYITALVIVLLAFACFHVYSTLTGTPALKIMDTIIAG